MERALGWSEADSSATYHYFVAASFFMTLLGGWLSDRVMGRYRTILYLSIGYVIGHATLAVADAAPDLRIDLLYLGMALIAVGAGGVKPNVSAFVGDQFGRAQRSLLDRVYSWFYFGINVGSASSQVATPWLLAGCGGLCVTTAVAVAFGVPSPIELIPQRGAGLDERLAAAFEDVGGPAVLVGMDTPQVTPQLLGHAASARRVVAVGDIEVLVAGIGGVLTAPEARGAGVGRAAARALQPTRGTR